MSALNFNPQPVIAGQKIGISPLFAALLWLIIIGLTLMNIYHISNFLVSKLTDVHSSIFFIGILNIIAVSASLLEVPLAKSIVTSYRLHGMSYSVFLQSAFCLVIASMAVIGGINSQLADANTRDSQLSAYSSNMKGLESQRKSLEREREVMQEMANRIQDEGSRKIAKLKADQDYYSGLASLDSKKAGQELSRPIKAVETGSWLHWVTITLFSLVCSFGVIFTSGFMAVYYQSLVSLPAFSLMSKANHAWSSSGEDFKTTQHTISPLNNQMSGFAKVEKTDVNRQHVNRPELDESRAGAVLDTSQDTSDRILKPDAEKGAKVNYTDSHYQAIKRAVANGDIKPTQKPVRSHLMKLNIRFVDDGARARKAAAILDQLAAESILIENPDFNKGGKVVAKYLLNPKLDQEPEKDIDSGEGESVGDFDITTRCGHCGTYDYNRIDALLDTQKGIVHCSGCGKNYMARSHLTNDSNPLSNELLAKAKAED